MSPSDVALILSRLDDLHAEISEVKREAKATNGNVRRLQIWQAKIDGAMWLVGRVPVACAVAASVAAVAAWAH